MEIALLYYAKEKWKLAYSLSIMRFAFNSHQLNGVKTIQGKTRFGGWNEMIFKVFSNLNGSMILKMAEAILLHPFTQRRKQIPVVLRLLNREREIQVLSCLECMFSLSQKRHHLRL